MPWRGISDNLPGVSLIETGLPHTRLTRPARVIIGIGGAITKVAAPALLHEIAHPRLRAVFGTIVRNSLFAHFVICSQN